MTPAAAETCPICHRRSDPRTRPFCSPRCADVDLGRWFTGHYRVPGPPLDPDDPALRDIPGEAPARPLDPDDGVG